MLHAGTLDGECLLRDREGPVTVPANAEMLRRESNVLFLCTGNSARSVMAECALNRWGAGKFRGFSAGSHPKGTVHPVALELLEELLGYATKDLRSKSWNEFALPNSPRIDFVITVCDGAAAEQCPVWPGHPAIAHWGLADPAAFEGTKDEQRRRFACSYRELERRIKAFVNLDIEHLDPSALQRPIEEIGRATGSEVYEH